MVQMATGAKQRRGYSTIAQSASEYRGSGTRVMSVDEEMGLTQEWMRVRASGDYETSVSMAMLFDTMAAHLVNASMRLGSLTKQDEAHGRDESLSFLSEREREKRKRDLATEATWYLQQAESIEKQKFVGQSSEWYHRLIAGLQYFSKKDDGKALSEFKSSLSLFESRAARIGVALAMIRGAKYVEALEELSRVYMSLYGAKFEKGMGEPIDSSTGHGDSDNVSPHHSHGSQHPYQPDYEWFRQHASSVLSNFNPSLEMLTTYSCLRPLMALLWSKIGSHQRAIDILQLHLKLVDEAMAAHHQGSHHSSTGPQSNTSIDHLPPNHDRSLAILAILLINQHSELMQKAKSASDVDTASASLSEAVSLLKRSFQLNPDNPNVLNHLSNIFFTQKNHDERDYERIDGFAAKAKEIASQAGFKEICAESSYYLGRSAHARSKYVSARQHYMDALVFSPNFPLPRFALAQLSLHENDISQAIEHLTKLDAKIPDLADAKAFLGKLHLIVAQNPSSPQDYQTHFSQASKLLTRAIQLNPSNLKAHLDLAELKERHAPLESLSSYLHASDLSFQLFVSESKLDLESYKTFAQSMWDAASSEDPEREIKNRAEQDLSLFPHWVKRLSLQTSRIVWNNVAVMRLQNGLLNEAKDALLRTILLGASTSSTLSSNSSANFINPASHIKSSGKSNVKALPTPVVFSALFAKPLRELLPPQVSSLLETFIVESQVYLSPSNVSTGYNLGLCYEKMKENNKASSIYASILAKYPSYLDAKLRLAIIKRDDGDLAGAEADLKEITASSSASDSKASSTAKSMAGIVLANLMMLKKEFKETQSMMDVLVNKLSASKSSSTSSGPSSASQDPSFHWSFGSDVYSLTSYANFFLSTSYASPNREKNLKWASGLFSTVLKQSPGNVYAANGLAIIQAMQAKEELLAKEKEEEGHENAMEGVTESLSSSKGSSSSSSQKMGGKWSEKSRNALNAFLAIREAMPNLPDILINLGHLSFAVGDYRGAAKHYQTVWTRYGAASDMVKSGQVASFLARSLAQLGHFDQAKSIMEAALVQSPEDEDMQFNLAVLCKEWALGVLKSVDMSLAARISSREKVNGGQDSDGSEISEEGASTSKQVQTGESMDVDQQAPSSSQDATQGNNSSSAASLRANLTSSSSTTLASASKLSSLVSTSSPSEDDQRKAIDLLSFAGPIFERLVNPKNPKHLFSTKKCEKFAKLCETNRELACEKLETFREAMMKEKEEEAERRKKVEEEEKNLLAALQAQEAALAAQLAEENEIAEALRLKSQQLVEEWAATGGDDDGTSRTSRGKTSSSRKSKPSRGRNAYDSDEDEESLNARIASRRSEEEATGEGEASSSNNPSGSSTQQQPVRTRRRTRDVTSGFDDDDDDDDDFDDVGKTGDSSSQRLPDLDQQRQIAEAQRRAQLEEMTKRRRQAAKRGHDGITPSGTEEDDEQQTGDQANEGQASSSSKDATGESSVAKRRKLRENKDRTTNAEDDDLEIPEGLDL
jgi:tetratricopeptide (TPR) repeat protein